MHETIIARKLIEEAEKHGKVKKIVVEVGELGHLPAHELRPTITAMVDWEVELIEKSAIVKCSCGYKGSPKILERGHDMCLFVCPECEEVPRIIEGNQIRLLSVEVE